MRALGLWLSLPLLLALSPLPESSTWDQWGQNGAHTGAIGVRGQPAQQIDAQAVSDPFTNAEAAIFGGDLGVHYQTPLLNGAQVCIEVKSGHYVGPSNWNSQTWGEECLKWRGQSLVPQWTVKSDWKPVPLGFGERGPSFEPVFHAAIAGSTLYLPAGGGTILLFDLATGAPKGRVNPFGSTLNARIYTVGPLATDGENVIYNTIELKAANPWQQDIVDAWLVKVAPNGRVRKVSFRVLTPDLAPGESCLGAFDIRDLPWPPSAHAVPPSSLCGSPRPPLNMAPAIARDGTIYVGSVAHLSDWTSWLVAVNPDLTPLWQTSLRDLFHDGCRVLLPPNGQPGGCRTGAATGVDPAQNRPGAGRLIDDSTASPVVAPDGNIALGAYTRYNYSQGHLVMFDPNGKVLDSYPFGWDVTPAVYVHDNTYSLVTKDNHYGGLGSYCDSGPLCAPRNASSPAGPEAYFITQLSSTLQPEWRFQSTNTRSCHRAPSGALRCVSDHPEGFEWCINAPAVDSAGTVYATSEDGYLYAIAQGGGLGGQVFLRLAIGGAYTPLALDRLGRIFTQNDGVVFAIGKAPSTASVKPRD
jgi:outer membrane protein assembly factor BamB